MDKISPKVLGSLLILVGLLPLLVYSIRIRQLLFPKAAVITPTLASSPFGVMTWGNTDQIKMQIANSLGAQYYRPLSLFLDSWGGSCSECDAAVNAGLKLMLTVRDNNNANPPANLNDYKTKLTQVINKYTPEVLVIENEENSDLFYTGTPQQYLAELKTGCDVSHSKNIKCTNGGLVSELVDTLASGSYPQGKECDKPENKKVCDQVQRGQTLLAGYKSSGADFVNFHWYIADTSKLSQAVSYLATSSGLLVMSNEVGQQGNTDPQQVTNVMQKIFDLNLPYAVWFSIDTSQGGNAMALTDINGTLRNNGKAYQQFTNDHFHPLSTPTPTPSATPSIPGDINLSGHVDILDYNILIAEFGKTSPSPADINGDGKVDIYDYNILVANFGK